MMKKTKIQPITKTKTTDYGDVKVNNFWLKINDKSNSQKEDKNLEQIISVLNEIQNSVVCIQTEELNHPEIIKAIFNASKKQNRIYILTNNKDEQLQPLAGICLIRYGIKNIGSFILINPNTTASKGIIFTAPFIETSLANTENITLELDNEQVKILFRFFSDNFWNKAEYEIIEDYNNPIETYEPPLDFLPNIKDFCDADFVKNEISEINSNAIISVSNLQLNNLINSHTLKKTKILTPITDNADYLSQLASLKNSVFANTTNILNLKITDNNSWLIPKTNISNEYNFFALELNDNQIEYIEELINNKIENAEYEFSLSKTRKVLENKTIRLLDNIENEIEIKPYTDINTKNIKLAELLPKKEFENQEPEFKDDNISIKINYTWKIIPFYTPKNAKKAKLYSNWEKYQKEYNTFITQIDEAIKESDNKNIGEKLKRWFLGKKQTIGMLWQELEEIKGVDISILEASKRNNIVKKLNELKKKAFSNLSEINIEIKKSEIEQEIEHLKQNKQDKEKEFEKWKKEQEELIKEQEENREKRLQEFLEKYKIKKEDLSKFKNELERKSGKKNRKKNPEEANKAQEVLSELKDIQGFHFSRKYEDEKRKLEKEIKSIETKIERKEKELKKTGENQTEKNGSSLNTVLGKGQNHKISKQKNEFNIPDIEYLPKIGELFEVGKQKYLEIEFWEDFEIGQSEANRLKAKLSAKRLWQNKQ